MTERCLDTDDQVFAKMLKDDGSLCSLEHQLYSSWLRLLRDTAGATPLSAIIYVDTDPETCVERISTRARQGESSIPLEYLKSLDKYQRNWVSSTSVPVLKVGAFPRAADVASFVDTALHGACGEFLKENISPVSSLMNKSAPVDDMKNSVRGD